MQQPPSMTTKKCYLEHNFASKVQACKNLKAVLIVFCWESRKFCKFGRNISLGWDKFKSAPQYKDDIFQLKAAHRNWPMMCSAWWGQCAWYQRIRPGLADLLLLASAGGQNSEQKKLSEKMAEKILKGPEKKYQSIRAGLVDLLLPLQGLRTHFLCNIFWTGNSTLDEIYQCISMISYSLFWHFWKSLWIIGFWDIQLGKPRNLGPHQRLFRPPCPLPPAIPRLPPPSKTPSSPSRPQRWSIFQGDGMVNVFF